MFSQQTREDSGEMSIIERKFTRRFIEEDNVSDTPTLSGEEELSEPEDLSDEEPQSVEESSPRPGRNQVRSCGRRNGDTVRSRSPFLQQTDAWKTEADSDIVPPLLRFFPKRTPGVQPPLNTENVSPGVIFSNFFDTEVLKLLVSNTNKNAKRNLKRGKKFVWTNVTPAEMKKYLGLLLYMSVLKLQTVSNFWRIWTIFHVPFPSTVMSRNRFFAISSNLYMSNPDKDGQNEKKRGKEDFDCLYRVRPLLEMMRTRCKSFYHPREHISMHEKPRPTRWGLRFFVVADVNGYTVDFKLYTGKSKNATENRLVFDVVTSLINKDFLGSGYIIYCDKFYTSPLLFRHLGQQGFGACGTYSNGRVGVPKTQENSLTKKSPRGSVRWIRDRDLLFVKWMDSREVSICSNIHSACSDDTVLRWRKGEDGSYQKVQVPAPGAVADYNRYMGGVDTSDQMLGTHSVRKIRRWYITIFHHFLDIAVTNSYIIHRELCASQQIKPMVRQDFQEELCAYLLGVPLKTDPLPSAHSKPHFPSPTTRGPGLEKSSRASKGRRQCRLCKRSTPWQCDVCSMPLCVQLDRNCFYQYHKGPTTTGDLDINGTTEETQEDQE